MDGAQCVARPAETKAAGGKVCSKKIPSKVAGPLETRCNRKRAILDFCQASQSRKKRGACQPMIAYCRMVPHEEQACSTHVYELQVLRCVCVFRERQGGCGKTGSLLRPFPSPQCVHWDGAVNPQQMASHEKHEGWIMVSGTRWVEMSWVHIVVFHKRVSWIDIKHFQSMWPSQFAKCNFSNLVVATPDAMVGTPLRSFIQYHNTKATNS